EQIDFTGYPLPHALLGGPGLGALKRNLAARLVRLDPERTFRTAYGDELAHFLGPLPATEEGRPPQVVFAVGGAGAQRELAHHFLPSFRPLVESGRLRVALVAGVRDEVAATFRAALEHAGLAGAPGVEILHEPDMPSYFVRFNQLLADADVLWTKP